MTKFLKASAIILLIFAIIFCSVFISFLIITKDAKLDVNKLLGTGMSVAILDENGNEITNASLDVKNKSVKVENLNDETVNAFIASEDKTFYKHKGLNYKRMFKALYKNVVSGSFKEGASTISQQLIKNTHLTGDKTINRKLKEIKLTRELERRYEKNDILEMYLNTIYFGHSCYGLQSAAEFYFNKKAEDLNLNESATIVGLLTSPNNYSPFKNPQKSLERRNTVLKCMKECKFIDEQTYQTAILKPLNAIQNSAKNKYNDYVNGVFDELEELDLNYYSLADGCKITTYIDKSAQNFIESIEYSCDNSVIITDNQSNGVRAYKSTVKGAKRQPGSTVKPIFVYAPAIEEKLINTFTKILDEKIDFGGYSPENYDKKFHGYVTVASSIENSYNVPAVKTLNSLTVDKAQKYINAMNVQLENDEKNLSLALGGMKYGLTLKDIADNYSVFANKGFYTPSRFIKEITTKEGKIIYKKESYRNHVFSEGTCSLINETLISTSKKGTAKKLKNLPFDVASKTGTCGNAGGNTDAYAVSYTGDSCFAVWLGDKDNKLLDITGGNECCKIMNEVLKNYYKNRYPAKLDTDTGTQTINIDRDEYELNNKTLIADKLNPKLNDLPVKILKGNSVFEQSKKFSNPSIDTPDISVNNCTVNIELCHAKYYSLIIKRLNNGKIETIYDGEWITEFKDSPNEGNYVYSVIPYYKNGLEIIYGKEIALPAVFVQNGDKSKNPQIKIPDIVNKDWFNY